MSREKPLFRENLERLDKKFPNKEILQPKDVAEYCGRTSRWAQDFIHKNVGREESKRLFGISKVKLASLLS